MANTSKMLEALHAADPKTLNMRFTAEQLAKRYAALKGAPAAPAPGAPAPVDQASVLAGQEGLNTTATGQAQGILDSGAVADPFEFQADDAARQRIEDSTYGRLTRGLDDQEGRATNQREQTLANRGIPYSSDPNSQYQMQLRDQNNRFDTARGNAHQDAVAAGGQELQRQYDIQSGTYNTKLGGVDTLSKIGLGGSVAYEQLNDADLNRVLEKAKLAFAKRQAKRNSGGSSDPGDFPIDGTAGGGTSTSNGL